MTLQLAMGNGSVWFLGRAGGASEAVSKLRRDELHESPIVRKSPKKSRTRVTRPSELKVLRRSRASSRAGLSVASRHQTGRVHTLDRLTLSRDAHGQAAIDC